MSENQSFPNEIDLGSKLPDSIGVGVTTDSPKKNNTKVLYPTLYISGVEGLDDLPDEGEALIHFKRKRVTKTTTEAGDEEHSADLEVTKLCLPAGEDGTDDELKDEFSKFAKAKGVTDEEESSTEAAKETPADEEAE